MGGGGGGGGVLGGGVLCVGLKNFMWGGAGEGKHNYNRGTITRGGGNPGNKPVGGGGDVGVGGGEGG